MIKKVFEILNVTPIESRDNTMKELKLAVFDMEGTLFRSVYQGQEFASIWKVLCSLCGPDAVAEDAANTRRYLAGGYQGYSAWVIDTLRILKKFGLKRQLFEMVINAIDYYPGVGETFVQLRRRGMTIAVISGGLKALADRVAVDHEVVHCFAAAEYFWNPDGTIRHWNVQPTDFEHKKTVLEILCRDLGISGDECLFVGDGRNDRAVAGFCALSIGFNPHDELRKEVDIIIEQPKGQENLSAVLEPISKYPNFFLSDFSDYKMWKFKIANPTSAKNLSESVLRYAFHTYLMSVGLTSKSADSYCSYLNNLCRNIAAAAWGGATVKNAFAVLEKAVLANITEPEFFLSLKGPLAGPHGRTNDMSSAAKQFYRFIRGGAQ